MNLTIPIKVDIRAQSTSGFTADTIDRRTSELMACVESEGMTEQIQTELEYLKALKARKFGA